jgi:hypothetical protein
LAYFSRTFQTNSKLKAEHPVFWSNYGNTNLGLVRSVVRSHAQQNQWCHKKIIEISAHGGYLSHWRKR